MSLMVEQMRSGELVPLLTCLYDRQHRDTIETSAVPFLHASAAELWARSARWARQLCASMNTRRISGNLFFDSSLHRRDRRFHFDPR